MLPYRRSSPKVQDGEVPVGMRQRRRQQAEREQPNLFQPLLPPPPTLSATTRTKLVTLVGKLLTEIVFIPTGSPREARHDEDRA
jgi:hypothetical protein